MTKPEFFALLDELIEADPGTVTGGKALAEIPQWDSLAIIGFIALLDERFGRTVPASEILRCATPSELATLAGVSG